MSRIRSIHPGLFTDEAFMGLSDAAQVFWIGLWVESDDQGIFEWKPLTLRARLRPSKDGSIDALLSELVDAQCILPYEIGGRKLGAIRNFCKFQRPKFPKSTHPITEDIRRYIALTRPPTVIHGVDDDPIPPKAEKSPQREDGGGKGTSDPNGSGARAPPSVDPTKALFDIGVSILAGAGRSDRDARSLVGKWRKSLGDEELATIVSAAARKTNPAEWITAAVAKAAERKAKPYGEAML